LKEKKKGKSLALIGENVMCLCVVKRDSGNEIVFGKVFIVEERKGYINTS
jgi:hypothetical protein